MASERREEVRESVSLDAKRAEEVTGSNPVAPTLDL
jgi:hypothetical protein